MYIRAASPASASILVSELLSDSSIYPAACPTASPDCEHASPGPALPTFAADTLTPKPQTDVAESVQHLGHGNLIGIIVLAVFVFVGLVLWLTFGGWPKRTLHPKVRASCCARRMQRCAEARGAGGGADLATCSVQARAAPVQGEEELGSGSEKDSGSVRTSCDSDEHKVRFEAITTHASSSSRSLETSTVDSRSGMEKV